MTVTGAGLTQPWPATTSPKVGATGQRASAPGRDGRLVRALRGAGAAALVAAHARRARAARAPALAGGARPWRPPGRLPRLGCAAASPRDGFALRVNGVPDVLPRRGLDAAHSSRWRRRDAALRAVLEQVARRRA